MERPSANKQVANTRFIGSPACLSSVVFFFAAANKGTKVNRRAPDRSQSHMRCRAPNLVKPSAHMRSELHHQSCVPELGGGDELWWWVVLGVLVVLRVWWVGGGGGAVVVGLRPRQIHLYGRQPPCAPTPQTKPKQQGRKIQGVGASG